MARIVHLTITMICTTLTLILAWWAFGPAVRKWAGEPRGFRDGYVSFEADLQALAVQALALACLFLALGFLAGRSQRACDFASILWVVNPFTIGASYFCYRQLMIEQGSEPVEYYGRFNWIALSVLALTFFAPLARIGVIVRNRGNSAAQPKSASAGSTLACRVAGLLIIALTLLLIPTLTSIIGKAVEAQSRPVPLTIEVTCRTPDGVPCHTVTFKHRSCCTAQNVYTWSATTAVRKDGSYLHKISDERETSVATGQAESFDENVDLYLAAPADERIQMRGRSFFVKKARPNERPPRKTSNGDPICASVLHHLGAGFGFRLKEAGLVAGVPVVHWVSQLRHAVEEFYLAPSLDCISLKYRLTRREGTEETEATSVLLGDPAPQLFIVPKGYNATEHGFFGIPLWW